MSRDSGVQSLDWLTVPEGYERGLYRISRLADHPTLNWRLSVVTNPRSGWSEATFVTISSHRTLGAARASARHHEIARTYRARINRHLVTGFVALICMAATFAFPGSTTLRLASTGAAIALLYVALRSLVIAVDLQLGDGWGRLYREPEASTPADRFVAWFTDRIQFTLAANDVESPSSVRVISPEDNRVLDSQR